MAEDSYSFDQARVRLEEIAVQVRKKDTSLEKSLDLLEEGVRLANLCTEQIDHTQWKSAVEQPAEPSAEEPSAAEVVPDGAPEPDEAPSEEPEAEGHGSECETPPGGADAPGDLPSEDPHGAAVEPRDVDDADPEA